MKRPLIYFFTRALWKSFLDWHKGPHLSSKWRGQVGVIGDGRDVIEEPEMQLFMLWNALLPSLADGQIPKLFHPRNLQAFQATMISTTNDWKAYFLLLFWNSLVNGRNSRFVRKKVSTLPDNFWYMKNLRFFWLIGWMGMKVYLGTLK